MHKMLYTLEKQTKWQMDGMGSPVWLKKTIFHLVKDTDEEKERWGEYVADECGSQDYSYNMKFETIGTFNKTQLKQIVEVINKMLVTRRLTE